MPRLELTEEQVIELVRQISPERRREALLVLAEDTPARREARMEYAEAQLRSICAEQGQNWATMTEEEREALIDDLVHEDRKCPG